MSALAKLREPAAADRAEPRLGEASSCVAFVGDLQSHAAVTAACQARFEGFEVRDGTSRQALEWLAEAPPPKVLIVDVSDAAQPLTALLPILAALEDRTSVIAIGTVNDIALYHELVQSGVQDYLVKPVSEKLLSASLAAIEAKKQVAAAAGTADAAGQATPKLLVAVMGTRGGVGTSTVAATCAWIMAEEQKVPTTLVDLDLQYGTIALQLDIEPTRGLREMLENPGRIDSLFIRSTAAKLTDRLSVMAAEETVDDEVRYDDGAVALLFDELHRQSDCVVVDLPRTAPRVRAKVLGLATHVLLVTDMTLAGLRDAIRQLGLAQQAAPQAQLLVVANHVVGKGASLSRAEFEKALGHAVDFLLPEEAKTVQAAATTGKPLAVAAKGSKLVAQLRLVTRQLGSGEQKKAKRSLFGFAAKKRR
ncbi:MAG: pilus assembly protein CpaE [Rhodospirillaceae bacterium]|nr:pilus assembly protein CpaE [Rhodospirillaceae bacterium]